MQVTLTLHDALYQRATWLAQLTGRSVADLLTDTIALSLSPFDPSGDAPTPVERLSDADLLALAESRMDAELSARLGELLHKQQAHALNADERGELAALLQMDQAGLLRKAQALREAVRRGLRQPLDA